MMNRLEMPFDLSSHRIDGNNGIAIKIVARPVAAPVVAGGRSKRHVESAGLFVEGHIPAPDVHAASVFPTVIQPCFMTWFPGQRHRMEFPQLCAGTNIERTRISGITTLGNFVQKRSEDRDILIDEWHSAPRNLNIDRAVLPESGCCLSSDRVDRHQTL